jgi:hypothetical protein
MFLTVLLFTLDWLFRRFHDQDPVPFTNGFRLQWRNGDIRSATDGVKCFTLSGGTVVGHPTVAEVHSYVWLYVW